MVGAVLLLVVGGLWWSLDGPSSGPFLAESEVTRESAAPEAMGALHPPLDIQEARAAAESFAMALYGDDVDGLRRLVTPELADQLLGWGRSASGPRHDVIVDGVTTQDAQPDRVLMKVAVRRGTSSGEVLEVVTVSVIRMDGRWLVADVAF